MDDEKYNYPQTVNFCPNCGSCIELPITQSEVIFECSFCRSRFVLVHLPSNGNIYLSKDWKIHADT